MTLEEFYDAFKETHNKGGRFHIKQSMGVQTGKIRQIGGKQNCPVTAVCNYKHKTNYHNFDIDRAARMLNLDYGLAHQIMLNSDGYANDYIKARMLEIIMS